MRKPKKGSIKAAADRAEKRSKGQPVDEPKVAIDPEIIKASPDDPAPKKLGRPTLYKPEFATIAAELCEGGATDEVLAAELGVSVKSINRWKAAHPEFRQALKDNKIVADEYVKRSLYHRALGGEYEEMQAIKLKRINYVDGKKVSEEEYIEMVPVTKSVPADTTAAIFWLKNRRSKEWRDVKQVEHGNVGDFDQMTDDQLAEFIFAEAAELRKTQHSGSEDETKH